MGHKISFNPVDDAGINVIDAYVQRSSLTPQYLVNAAMIALRLGQEDHYPRTIYQDSSMSRREIYPLLIGLDKPKHTSHFVRQQDLSGCESAQRKRSLRAEIEEEKLAAAAGRRHLLKLYRKVA